MDDENKGVLRADEFMETSIKIQMDRKTEENNRINCIHLEIIELVLHYKDLIKSKLKNPETLANIKEAIKKRAQNGERTAIYEILKISRYDYYLKKYNNCYPGLCQFIKNLLSAESYKITDVAAALRHVFKTFGHTKEILMLKSTRVSILGKDYDRIFKCDSTISSEYLHLGMIMQCYNSHTKFINNTLGPFMQGFKIAMVTSDYIPAIYIRCTW